MPKEKAAKIMIALGERVFKRNNLEWRTKEYIKAQEDYKKCVQAELETGKANEKLRKQLEWDERKRL